MSSGAAMGNGIYMADQLSVSCGYAGGRGAGGGHWPQSATGTGKSPVIVAVCEVINRCIFVDHWHVRTGKRRGYQPSPSLQCAVCIVVWLPFGKPADRGIPSVLLFALRLTPLSAHHLCRPRLFSLSLCRLPQRGVQAQWTPRTPRRVLRCSRRGGRRHKVGLFVPSVFLLLSS